MNAQSPKDSARKLVLVVDDEPHFLTSIIFILQHIGIGKVETCNDSRLVLEMIRKNSYTAILLDISMPYIQGTILLDKIINEHPDLPVIMITAVNEVPIAVSCIKSGAFDYLLKPIEEERLASSLYNAFRWVETRTENRVLRDKLLSGSLQNPEIFGEFVTQNKKLIGVFSYIEAIAPSRQPVLITGETGTGKELAAKALHEASARTGPYVPVNIAGYAENMIDDELFGHCKGAFTGAQSERKGMVEKAAGGTLFLDEIGDLPLPMQVKLLRLLQEGQYQRLGSDEIVKTDARMVFATNLNMEEQVKNGAFRTDLYYRLITHRVHLPPLLDRKEDIPFLVDKFLEAASMELHKKKPSVPKELYTLLSNYSFPGNVRELRCMVFDAMSLHSSGTLSLESFKSKIFIHNDAIPNISQTPLAHSDKKVQFSATLPTIKEIQELLIEEALKAADGNQTIAAGILGMSRRALSSRLSRQ
jgi:DNA-binding NtrC family response regulator